MSTADIQLSVVFGGQYSFEKLQSDWEQADSLERNFIVNKPDLVNFEAETVTTETVIFEENPTGAIAPLKLQYNPAEKTIEFGLKDGGILQLGKEMFEEYVNVDTVALTNGMIVSTAAISGNRKGIKRTDFTSLTSIRSIVGMVTVASIGTNQSGRVTTKGIVNELNTSGIGEGSQLWGNPSVLGGWSGNKPAKPQYAVQIGQVVVASATVGSVELNIAKDVRFSDLADVNGSTSAIDDTDTIPKRDADGIIREISVADIKADFKADTDLIYEPLLGFTPENTANKGQANGYASLGADGLVPSNQLPSFVDDVLEFANLAAFPATGEQGKIYVALDTNKTYRWSGSTYIYITSGAVDSVAGKTGVVTLVKADVGLGNVDNTSDVNKPISNATQTALNGKVSTTGNENIAGVKTFDSSPIVPTPSTGGQAANKAYVDTVVVTQANVEQVRSQATNKVPSSKLLDDELKRAEYLIDDNLIADYASCTWVTGQYISAGGTISAFGTFSYCSNYIPVVGGQKYTFQSSGLAIAWYDASQVFISLSGGGSDPVAVRTFTAPSNTAFARVNQSNVIKESFNLYLGESYSFFYTIKSNIIKFNQIGDIELSLSDFENSEEVPVTILADYASCTWVTGQYISAGGTISAFGTFSYCSNYIPVVGGQKYTFQSSGLAIAWYDASQTFIKTDGKAQDSFAFRTFTAPSNAAFARVNQDNNIKTLFALYLGDLPINKYKITDLKVEKSQIIGYSESTGEDFSFTKSTINAISNALDFSSYQITGNVVVSGDSTIAAYAGGTALSAIISCSGTMTNIAAPGHTINQQLSAWNALDAGVRSAVNYVFVQIGLNDLDPAESAQTAIGRLQAFINKIKADTPSLVIVNGTMIPCKQRLINIYGATNGLIAFQKWQIMNYFIEKGMVLNVDKVSSEHTYQLADSNWNLDSAFDTGDAIHENTAGRKIIAYSWLSAIK